jgi:3-dehydroquinate dehydratase/shikimate dehydrogenase
MPKICLCLTAKTLERDLEILEANRRYVDLVELRADCLLPDERFCIRSFPEKAGIPVILTARRKIDGGYFENGEGSRVTMLSNGLAFADADRRRNFAYIDLEEDLDVPGLEEAARAFGTRIIRSYHNIEGTDEDIAGKFRKLRRVGDEIVKVAVTPRGLADLSRAWRAAKTVPDTEKILACMGPYGRCTRILAAKTGSFLSYCRPPEEDGAGLSQLSPEELVEVYRFHQIGRNTKIFGLTGYPLNYTASPLIFNTAFSHENVDAVYLPFPSDSIEQFLSFARELEIAGAGITIPYKEAVLPFLANASGSVEAAGACNTIVPAGAGGWSGSNTDGEGFSESLLSFLGRKNLNGVKLTLLGAGGAAKAAACEISRLGGRCLILNRNPVRAKELAALYRFKWGGLDGHGFDLMDRYSEVVIQATSAGSQGSGIADPFELYRFTGRETVMDLVYNPPRTPFLCRAVEAGCRVINGFDMLIKQAAHQYRRFTGKDYPAQLFPRLEGIAEKYRPDIPQSR